MKTKIEKIKWLEGTKVNFSWLVSCSQETRPDDHYLLLYKPLNDCSCIDRIFPLKQEDSGVRQTDLFCDYPGVEKSRTEHIDGVSGKIVAFTIYPCFRGTKDPCLDAGASGCAYIGQQSPVIIRAENREDGCTNVRVHTDCAIGSEDIKLCVAGKEFGLPFVIKAAGDYSALLLHRVPKDEIVLRLTGEAKWKCKLVSGDERYE